MSKYICDLETNGLYQSVTKIHCIVIKDLDTQKVITFVDDGVVAGDRSKGLIKDGIDLLQKADLIVGHNFIDYDMRVIEKLFKIKLDIKNIIDTLLLSHMLYPHLAKHTDCPTSKVTVSGRKQIGPHSLENWGYYMGLGKVEYEDWTTYTPQMLERCIGDVEITHKLYNYFLGENVRTG